MSTSSSKSNVTPYNIALPANEKPIAFHPAYARAFGSIEKALYIQQLCYWSDKGSRDDGFIYKTKKEIEDETTLSPYQQDNCRKHFERLGILETKLLKAKGVPTLHYRVNFGRLQKVMLEYQETIHPNIKKLNNRTSRNLTTGQQESMRVSPRTYRANSSMSDANLLPENTTESTTEKEYILSGSSNPTAFTEGLEGKHAFREANNTPEGEGIGKPNNAGSTDSSTHGKGKVDHPPYKEIIDYLNEKAGTNFKPTTKVTRRYIRARWNEGFRLEDFKKVIDKKVRQWKHKPDMVEYLRPTTLFGTKFEAYLMAAQHKTGWEVD